MRRAAGAWAMLACATLAGCLGPDGPRAFFRSAEASKHASYAVGGFGNAFGNSLAPDDLPGLSVESILYERPLGDALFDRDLWTNAAAFLPPNTKALLEENGFRAAILGGNLPPAFLKLLESKNEAIAPHRLSFVHRTEEVLPTLGPIVECKYDLLGSLGGDREAVKLKDANAGILIRPELCGDGRVKLYCEPQVQHGERQEFIRPNADATGFQLQGEFPVERYPRLGFEATLAAGEFLVIGAPADATELLGSALFTVESKSEPRQRILVVRANYRKPEPAQAMNRPRTK